MSLPKNSVDSRIQLLDRPKAAPGHCAICGFAGGFESDGRKFIDWGWDIDFYGAVIICSLCVENIANLLGFASPEQVAGYENSLTVYLLRVSDLEAENAGLRSSVDSFDFLRTLSVPNEPGAEAEKPFDPVVDEQDSSGGPEIIPDSSGDGLEPEFIEPEFKSEQFIDL